MSVAEDALAQLMCIAARPSPDFVDMDVGMPAFATRFAVDEVAAAALAASGVLAADIWVRRTGERQRVTVDSREAAASLIGFLHQRFEDPGRGVSLAFARTDTAIDGFMPARGGRHVYLHPGFEHNSRAMLRLLGCADEREAVRNCVAGWEAPALEKAMVEAGLSGAMVRGPEEWDESDQGRLLAARPVVEVIRIGDSPVEDFPKYGDAPLSDIRVLDLTRILAGPTCARTLAQYGAEVLQVGASYLPSIAPFVSDTGHGKRSTFIDLKSEAGRNLLRDLLMSADILSQSYRSGALEQLGLGPAALAVLRPGLIYVSINCYGHDGAWRNRPGWEQLAQAVTGMAYLHGGEADPRIQPAAVTDCVTGYLAAFGAMIALLRRATWGGSYLVNVSLSQTAMWVRKFGFDGPERLDRVVELREQEIRSWSIDSQSGFGPMTHLRPAVQLDRTPARWRHPTVPLGSHPPVWNEAPAAFATEAGCKP